MQGKKLSLFIESLYVNPEMEFEYAGKRYLVSGYRDDNNEYVLQVDTIEASSKPVFFSRMLTSQNVLMLLKERKCSMKEQYTRHTMR